MDQFPWPAAEVPSGDELAAWAFWNAVPSCGPRTFAKLVTEFGSAERAAREVGPASWPGLSPRARAFVANCPDPVAYGRQELAHARRLGARAVPGTSHEYPPLLRKTHDPPILLYVRGDRDLADSKWIAVVGTRAATAYGLSVARRLARDLAGAGVGVVSGLARGIDSAAHLGAMDAGGPTCGVLGSGLGCAQPPGRRNLIRKVERLGCVVSSFPMGFPAGKYTFPARNRIISGMALGCVVVEAGERSGSFITVDLALSEGRAVFAVPGDIGRPTSRGTNRLIGEGATVVTGADTILEELGISAASLGGGNGTVLGAACQPRGGADGSLWDEAVLEAVTVNTAVDDILAAVSLPLPTVLSTLSRLEIAGKVRRGHGYRFTRSGC
ncbi:MAG: DNA-processing protein DprA [Firmicutes bacterium]|nr:DNA-processing protein DprA [Bacillota bacterium]